MSDLISRAAAIDALVDELAHRPDGYWDSGLKQYDVEVVLNQQPSIDAVEVVRCRDCTNSYLHKAWDESEPKRYCRNLRNAWAKDSDLCVEDDDFCKYGEQKDE